MIEVFQTISFSSMEKKKNEEKLLKRKAKQGPDFLAGMRIQIYIFMGEKKKYIAFFSSCFPLSSLSLFFTLEYT